MKTLTLAQYAEDKKARRNKIGVADKLHAFLTANIATLKKDVAYEVSASDFLGKDFSDFHYNLPRKMLEAQYSEKLTWDFPPTVKGRVPYVRISVK